MSSKLQSFFKNPGLLFLTLGHREFFNWMDDELYLKIAYRVRMGKKLNLKNPKTFNEKLQWLKVHNRNPLCTRLVDKHEVRSYIAETIGEQYLIPLVGGPWDCFDEIDFDKLPDQFVLKCTHDSGGLIICKNKADLDVTAAKRKIEACLKHNFYWGMREWPYKDVKPRIIAEKYMEDPIDKELKDYKVMCFNGNPKLIQVHSGRYQSHVQDFYDTDWNYLEMSQGTPTSGNQTLAPSFLNDMLELSRKLSAGYPHLRVDWYYVNKRMYFGELTFFDGSGFWPFDPAEWDEKIGSWIDLSSVHSEKQAGKRVENGFSC